MAFLHTCYQHGNCNVQFKWLSDSLKYVCSVITISSNFKIWWEKNLIFTVIHLVKSFWNFFLIWCVNCMLTVTHWTEVCGPHLLANWKSHYIHQIKWWVCLLNVFHIITGSFCKWFHASVCTHTITWDGRQDSNYHYPVYHYFWSPCFNSVYCHYFQVLTHLT